jgi:A/G-specific adenine glycosylase
VARFYGPFFDRFPSWQAIDEATTRELEEFLKPVGLWQRRAKSLKNLAYFAVIAGGKSPVDDAELPRVPAVG